MEFECMIISGERSVMMESCVRIRAGDSYWMAPLDYYEREVRNGMVPFVLDYEQEVRRGWTTSERFVEACDILKAIVNLCKIWMDRVGDHVS